MEIDQSVPPPEPEAWQMETKGFTQLPKTKVITPLRPTPGFSNRPSKRDKVTSVLEIKQLAWAEGNRESSARTAKDYNQYLKNTNPERSLEKSCCWLCGKPFYEKPLGNPKHLGYLEVEHALPLKLGYMLLTIPGEITYDEKGNATPKQKYNPVEKSEIEMEILRSHRLCNNLKSNINFFKYTGKEFEIKKDLVKTFEDKLTELQKDLNGTKPTTNTQTIRCKNGMTQFGIFVGVNNYRAKVNEAKLNAIVKRLNEKFPTFTAEELAGEISKKVYLGVTQEQRNAYALSLIQYFNKYTEATEAETQTINENYTTILNAEETEKENKSSKLSSVPEDQEVVGQASPPPAPADSDAASVQQTPDGKTYATVDPNKEISENDTLDVLIDHGVEYFDIIQNENRSELQGRINNLRKEQPESVNDKIKKELRIEIAQQLLNKLPTDGSGAGTSTAEPAPAPTQPAAAADSIADVLDTPPKKQKK